MGVVGLLNHQPNRKLPDANRIASKREILQEKGREIIIPFVGRPFIILLISSRNFGTDGSPWIGIIRREGSLALVEHAKLCRNRQSDLFGWNSITPVGSCMDTHSLASMMVCKLDRSQQHIGFVWNLICYLLPLITPILLDVLVHCVNC